MKKLINLIALVMLVSTNVLTPFSYAQVETPELIPASGVEMVTEDAGESEKILENNEEISKNNEETPEVNLEEKEELEQGKQGEEVPENVLLDIQDAVESPTIDENKDEDTEKGESDKVAQQEEENAELEKQEEGNIGEEKENIETEDLLLKSLVDTELYAVDDPIECGSGYVLNADGTGCELIQVTFDANGGSFDGGEDTKTVDTTVTELPPVRYSHTANIDDDGVATSVYANNLSKNDVVTIPGATSLDIEVRFATESPSYDWLAIYPAGITPTASNYSSASISNGRLGGHGSYSSYTKPSDSNATYHRNFTVDGDTAQFYFKSDSNTAYYGYYAIVNGIDAGNSYVCSYDITAPTREGYIFDGWYVDTGYTQIFDTCLFNDTTVYAKWYQPQPKDIVVEAIVTEANQTLKINKYFANAYTVDWRDGSPIETVSADTIHRYATPGTHTIILSPATDRWTFQYVFKPLVPTDGTTVTDVKIVSMPSLADGFGNSETNPGSDFFHYFNYNGKLTSLPSGSFDTSKITTVGGSFFGSFNSNGQLTSLPEGSFRLSTGLTTVGNNFFYSFNFNGELTSLPEGSFDTSKITTVGNYFFYYFNSNGELTSLPEGSFDTSKITTVGSDFFHYFNYNGKLTSLPSGSFDISKITTVGDYFFYYFNNNGKLTSLPESFKLNSVAYNKTSSYQNAFYSPSYTLNRNVSDIISGVTAPNGDRNTFSDNQPGRCGVNANWLVTTADACSISYDDGLGGTGEFKYTADTTGVEVGSGMIEPTREGYSFSGWIDALGNNVEEVIFPDMDGQTLYANWTPNEYTITFEDSSEENEKIVISGLYLSETSSIKYPKWTKEGYKIVWDKEIPATMPAENMIIKASWEKNGYSGGGGRGGSSKKTDEDTHGSAEDSQKNTQDDKNTENVIQSDPEHSEGGSKESSNTPVDSSDKSSEGQEILSPSDSPSSAGQVSFTKEQKDAYTFAKENGITTKDTIQSAQMNGKLTRIAMAKMLSQYAINVLGQTPDTSKTVKFKDVTNKKDADYDNGVTLAYQLGIMGQNMKDNKFRPNDEVTRAEFVTALSRLLYSTSDGEYKSTSKYYTPHMAKLYNEGIINNTDPGMKERRGYVMIMLMRSAK